MLSPLSLYLSEEIIFLNPVKESLHLDGLLVSSFFSILFFDSRQRWYALLVDVRVTNSGLSFGNLDSNTALPFGMNCAHLLQLIPP